MKTNFLGLDLKSPVIIAAGPWSCDGESIRQSLATGVGAVITETIVSDPKIEMDKITLEKSDDVSTLIVYVKFRDPQPGMALAQALTYPLVVAETELTELPDQIQLKVQYIE
jgi:dihydroorotate dehydrogenase